MVATPLFDLIVASTWVSALTVVLIARAVNSWLRYRHAARYARMAARLAAATDAAAKGRPALKPAGKARASEPVLTSEA